MRGQQVADLPGDADPGRDENDQVVADPLQVSDQMVGQHDAEALIRDRLHQALQELPPGQRVEAGDRLVRTNGPVLDPAWAVTPVSLEDLVLAYMSRAGDETPARRRHLGVAS